MHSKLFTLGLTAVMMMIASSSALEGDASIEGSSNSVIAGDIAGEYPSDTFGTDNDFVMQTSRGTRDAGDAALDSIHGLAENFFVEGYTGKGRLNGAIARENLFSGIRGKDLSDILGKRPGSDGSVFEQDSTGTRDAGNAESSIFEFVGDIQREISPDGMIAGGDILSDGEISYEVKDEAPIQRRSISLRRKRGHAAFQRRSQADEDEDSEHREQDESEDEVYNEEEKDA